jgi:hypothetical protein
MEEREKKRVRMGLIPRRTQQRQWRGGRRLSRGERAERRGGGRRKPWPLERRKPLSVLLHKSLFHRYVCVCKHMKWGFPFAFDLL